MNIAIIYTSKYGTTAKVAQTIAGQLTGSQVSIIDLKKVKCPDLNSFDGIILGTSVYAGTSPKTMQRFCKDKSVSQIDKEAIGKFILEFSLDR
ncbi:hypothetical protein FACS1894155_03780 [Bacteroidia bacterium]|nr:hypothetical protein FACS1894155_03780 [Bacteroidia bacterium]